MYIGPGDKILSPVASFKSLTTIISENSIVLPFFQYKSIRDYDMNKLNSIRAPNAAYQVSRPSAFWFRRRRFFKVFTIYGHGGM